MPGLRGSWSLQGRQQQSLQAVQNALGVSRCMCALAKRSEACSTVRLVRPSAVGQNSSASPLREVATGLLIATYSVDITQASGSKCSAAVQTQQSCSGGSQFWIASGHHLQFLQNASCNLLPPHSPEEDIEDCLSSNRRISEHSLLPSAHAYILKDGHY